MIVEEAEYEEGEEERSVAVDSTSTAVGSADSEDENNSGKENSVQCGCCEARQTCGQAGKICNGLFYFDDSLHPGGSYLAIRHEGLLILNN